MFVYSCKNKNCNKYLINGTALCKVESDSGDASLDIETGIYTTSDGLEIGGNVYCFHCKAKAVKKQMPSQEHHKKDLIKDLDELDSEIENLMKMMGVT